MSPLWAPPLVLDYIVTSTVEGPSLTFSYCYLPPFPSSRMLVCHIPPWEAFLGCTLAPVLSSLGWLMGSCRPRRCTTWLGASGMGRRAEVWDRSIPFLAVHPSTWLVECRIVCQVWPVPNGTECICSLREPVSRPSISSSCLVELVVHWCCTSCASPDTTAYYRCLNGKFTPFLSLTFQCLVITHPLVLKLAPSWTMEYAKSDGKNKALNSAGYIINYLIKR